MERSAQLKNLDAPQAVDVDQDLGHPSGQDQDLSQEDPLSLDVRESPPMFVLGEGGALGIKPEPDPGRIDITEHLQEQIERGEKEEESSGGGGGGGTSSQVSM